MLVRFLIVSFLSLHLYSEKLFSQIEQSKAHNKNFEWFNKLRESRKRKSEEALESERQASFNALKESKVSHKKSADKQNRLILLIDESLTDFKKTTLYPILRQALWEKSAPVICSASFMYSLLDNLGEKEKDIFHEWDCYYIPESFLFLLLHKQGSVANNELPLFNLSMCERIELNQATSKKEDLLKVIDHKIGMHIVNEEFLYPFTLFKGLKIVQNKKSFSSKALRRLLVHHILYEDTKLEDLFDLALFFKESGFLSKNRDRINFTILQEIERRYRNQKHRFGGFFDHYPALVLDRIKAQHWDALKEFIYNEDDKNTFNDLVSSYIDRLEFLSDKNNFSQANDSEVEMIKKFSDRYSNANESVLSEDIKTLTSQFFDKVNKNLSSIPKQDLKVLNKPGQFIQREPFYDYVARHQRPFNILWTGHGSMNVLNSEINLSKSIVLGDKFTTVSIERMICGTETETLQEALSFFNKLNVFTVTLISCYSGGANRNYITPAFNRYIQGRYNYTIAMLSGSDRVVIVSLDPARTQISDYFSIIDQSKQKVPDPNWLQRALSSFGKEIVSNVVGNIPQYLLPGANDFKILLPVRTSHNDDFTSLFNKSIGVINDVYLRQLSSDKNEQSQSLSLKNKFEQKKMLFIYPEIIDQPIQITPQIEQYTGVNFEFAAAFEKAKRLVPSMTDNIPSLWICQNDLKLIRWTNSKLIEELNLLPIPPSGDKLNDASYFCRFPYLMSMHNKSGFHAFKKIKLSPPKSYKKTFIEVKDELPEKKSIVEKSAMLDYDQNKATWRNAGFLNFLYYALLSPYNRLSKKTFFIKELVAYDDLSLYSEVNNIENIMKIIINHLNKIPDDFFYKGPHLFSNFIEFGRDYNQPITFHDVLVETESFFSENNTNNLNKVTVLFRYEVWWNSPQGDEYWLLEFDERMRSEGDKNGFSWKFEKKSFYQVKNIYNRLYEESKKSGAYDWTDFIQVPGYREDIPLTFQIFDLYDDVKKMRDEKDTPQFRTNLLKLMKQYPDLIKKAHEESGNLLKKKNELIKEKVHEYCKQAMTEKEAKILLNKLFTEKKNLDDTLNKSAKALDEKYQKSALLANYWFRLVGTYGYSDLVKEVLPEIPPLPTSEEEEGNILIFDIYLKNLDDLFHVQIDKEALKVVLSKITEDKKAGLFMAKKVEDENETKKRALEKIEHIIKQKDEKVKAKVNEIFFKDKHENLAKILDSHNKNKKSLMNDYENEKEKLEGNDIIVVPSKHWFEIINTYGSSRDIIEFFPDKDFTEYSKYFKALDALYNTDIIIEALQTVSEMIKKSENEHQKMLNEKTPLKAELNDYFNMLDNESQKILKKYSTIMSNLKTEDNLRVLTHHYEELKSINPEDIKNYWRSLSSRKEMELQGYIAKKIIDKNPNFLTNSLSTLKEKLAKLTEQLNGLKRHLKELKKAL